MNKYQEALEFIEDLAGKEDVYIPYCEMDEVLKPITELVDKGTPKKANPLFLHKAYTRYHCPCCGHSVNNKREWFNYCPNCGQCIDWEIWKGKENEE